MRLYTTQQLRHLTVTSSLTFSTVGNSEIYNRIGKSGKINEKTQKIRDIV